MLNEQSRCVNVAVSLAFFIQYDHHDAVAKILSLSYSWFFIDSPFSLAGFVLLAMTSENFDSLKGRDLVLYLHYIRCIGFYLLVYVQ